MKKQEFFKLNDEKFLKIGFVKEEIDPLFYYYKTLISEDVMIECGLNHDEAPKLLFGSTGGNNGFCIYTGEHFIWLDSQSPEEADALSNHIVSIEPV